MNLKKKILCGVLASSFVFGGLFGSVQTFAVGGEDSGSSAVAVDPSVNVPDEHGCTPLMNALREYNVEEVRELLAKGASLEIPSEYWNGYYREISFFERKPSPYQIYRDKMKGKEEYTNAFEKFCLQVTARFWRCNDDYETYDGYLYRDSDDRKELAPKAREITEIILKHCVEKGIHLNVNPDLFRLWRIGDAATYCHVFDSVKEIFEKYKKEHGDLFTSEGGRELYFTMDDAVFRWYTEEDGKSFYSSAKEELKVR